MKQIILLTVILFQTGIFGFSQSLKTEIKYLCLTNKQGNKEIIEDNLRNAELVAYKIIENTDKYSEYGNSFLSALAESYLKTEHYEKAFFTLVRQTVFFPNNKNKNTESFFKLASDGIGIQNINQLYDKLQKVEKKNRDEKYLTLFDVAVSEGIDNIDDLLYEYMRLYKSKTKNPEPDRLKQYEFYTLIGIRNKHKFDMISFTEPSDNLLCFHKSLTKKQKRKVFSAACDYYIDLKNKPALKNCLAKYKPEKKGLYGNILFSLYKISGIFMSEN